MANNKSWCWTGTNNSTYDNKSDMAVMAQRILKVDGWYSGAVDGQYGTASRSAVVNYQSNRGITVDGLIGGDTWYQLLYTSISTCPNIPQVGHTNYGYRIGTETCGRYLQQSANYYWLVRSYNNSGTSVSDDYFVIPTINGPTSLPTSSSGARVSTAVDQSQIEAYDALAAPLGLDVSQATRTPFPGADGAMLDVVFTDADSGATVVRSEAPSSVDDANSLFDHLSTYPSEFGYDETVIDGNPAMTRTLADGSTNTVMFDADTNMMVTIAVDPSSAGGIVPDWLVDRAAELL